MYIKFSPVRQVIKAYIRCIDYTTNITYKVQHKPINFMISRFSQPVRTCSCPDHYQKQCDLVTFQLY